MKKNIISFAIFLFIAISFCSSKNREVDPHILDKLKTNNKKIHIMYDNYNHNNLNYYDYLNSTRVEFSKTVFANLALDLLNPQSLIDIAISWSLGPNSEKRELALYIFYYQLIGEDLVGSEFYGLSEKVLKIVKFNLIKDKDIYVRRLAFFVLEKYFFSILDSAEAECNYLEKLYSFVINTDDPFIIGHMLVLIARLRIGGMPLWESTTLIEKDIVFIKKHLDTSDGFVQRKISDAIYYLCQILFSYNRIFLEEVFECNHTLLKSSDAQKVEFGKCLIDSFLRVKDFTLSIAKIAEGFIQDKNRQDIGLILYIKLIVTSEKDSYFEIDSSIVEQAISACEFYIKSDDDVVIQNALVLAQALIQKDYEIKNISEFVRKHIDSNNFLVRKAAVGLIKVLINKDIEIDFAKQIMEKFIYGHHFDDGFILLSSLVKNGYCLHKAAKIISSKNEKMSHVISNDIINCKLLIAKELLDKNVYVEEVLLFANDLLNAYTFIHVFGISVDCQIIRLCKKLILRGLYIKNLISFIDEYFYYLGTPESLHKIQNLLVLLIDKRISLSEIKELAKKLFVEDRIRKILGINIFYGLKQNNLFLDEIEPYINSSKGLISQFV